MVLFRFELCGHGIKNMRVYLNLLDCLFILLWALCFIVSLSKSNVCFIYFKRIVNTPWKRPENL